MLRLQTLRAPGAIALLAAVTAACSAPDRHVESAASPAPQVPAPIVVEGSVYEFAGAVPLTPHAPEDYGTLHNVFRLSDNIVSGSEPHDAKALEQLRDWGIRTILTVDGSEPMAEEAAAFGMRYVHVPIQYKGITEDEAARIAKTFRELEGPFYVHCFHGKHRGPAGAAIGRIVLDGVSRDQAVAEMRQYCGTGQAYEGLYQSVAFADLPSAAETAALAFDFPAISRPDGIVAAMVPISRAHDFVADLAKRDFASDPSHPDVDALNEARKLLANFRTALSFDEVQTGPADEREWFRSSVLDSERLVAALERYRAGDTAAGDDAKAAFASLKKTCNACHDVYRN